MMGFLYTRACHHAYYCPVQVPIALKLTLKAGSRGWRSELRFLRREIRVRRGRDFAHQSILRTGHTHSLAQKRESNHTVT